MEKGKHPISRIELLRMKHRALRMRKYRSIQRMSPRISTSIWQTPIMHSFSRPLSPINKEYTEPEERSEKKKMNWAQAKRAFPKLPLFGDADRDGIYNMFDCRPFNKRMQGPEHKLTAEQQNYNKGLAQEIEKQKIKDFGVAANKKNREKSRSEEKEEDDSAQDIIDSI
jgi:hypothetical protein